MRAPQIGRSILFTVSAAVAAEINARRGRYNPAVIEGDKERLPAGAQGHKGNSLEEGDVIAGFITKVIMPEIPASEVEGVTQVGYTGYRPTWINAQFLLDGNDSWWGIDIEIASQPTVGKAHWWDWEEQLPKTPLAAAMEDILTQEIAPRLPIGSSITHYDYPGEELTITDYVDGMVVADRPAAGKGLEPISVKFHPRECGPPLKEREELQAMGNRLASVHDLEGYNKVVDEVLGRCSLEGSPLSVGDVVFVEAEGNESYRVTEIPNLKEAVIETGGGEVRRAMPIEWLTRTAPEPAPETGEMPSGPNRDYTPITFEVGDHLKDMANGAGGVVVGVISATGLIHIRWDEDGIETGPHAPHLFDKVEPLEVPQSIEDEALAEPEK